MKGFFLIFIAFSFSNSFAQEIENEYQTTLKTSSIILKEIGNSNHFELKQLIVPTSLIGYGFVALSNQGLQTLNKNAKRNFNKRGTYYTTTVDNYIQYAPALAVYGLNAFGIKGKNNFKDRTIIYALSNVFSCVMVSPIKSISKKERPDQSACNSFPSGHTSTAFAAAEFLRQEYIDVSPWYGVGGYLVATATGILRVYNNRHWLSDIIAGAGIGILSTKAVYWVYPYVKRKVFKERVLDHKYLNAEDIKNLPLETYDY